MANFADKMNKALAKGKRISYICGINKKGNNNGKPIFG
jgi:hypothetical protein